MCTLKISYFVIHIFFEEVIFSQPSIFLMYKIATNGY